MGRNIVEMSHVSIRVNKDFHSEIVNAIEITHLWQSFAHFCYAALDYFMLRYLKGYFDKEIYCKGNSTKHDFLVHLMVPFGLDLILESSKEKQTKNLLINNILEDYWNILDIKNVKNSKEFIRSIEISVAGRSVDFNSLPDDVKNILMRSAYYDYCLSLHEKSEGVEQ